MAASIVIEYPCLELHGVQEAERRVLSFVSIDFVDETQEVHSGSHERLRSPLQLFVDAYNMPAGLKLRGLTPGKFIHHAWAKEPKSFSRDSSRYTLGPYS